MENAFFVLDHFYKTTSVPVHYFSPDGELSLLSRGFSPAEDPLDDLELKTALLTPSAESKPGLHFEENEVVSCAFRDTMEHWIVLGPVSLSPVKKEARDDYARKHHIAPEALTLPHKTLQIFSAAVSMLYCCFTGKTVDETELVLFSAPEGETMQVNRGERLQPYQLSNAEQGLQRFTYADERRIMERVTWGDVDAIKKSYSAADFSLVTSSVGKMADVPLKNFEYMICISVAMAARAAIHGGLSDESAFSVSDILLQELSKCKDIGSMMRVQMEAMHTFAALVKETNERRSRLNYVEQAKQYLQSHINKPFSLNELASRIGENKSYLCRKFRESEGMTIQEYLRRIRVDAAKNMLRYSDQDISSIAAYLGFASQSHFGAVFKELTGLTPRKYREEIKP